ncbi:ESX secretion-associated protein EspG [Amycolatopsis acidiphila]|uniref:ESX secretion-associated protein EspG n=1 Tax=Amycolatopsis acidiphila TaxID=715473 RepID=A0A558AH68_9PSEU|nr:ESX secretion-associated protein EspG [Amycolatopsis acidiphila]TVT23607.1 ESX secretion-associated protein EspG [Amycolatopsis acidiphila]UIJ58592.1 ESX secretion-associated protein EspG [Amycolatopsis acidiphila]GHG76617.1 ESX secretion-associated protein EspG [Amycolatopsis acidiphila]
MPAVRSDYLSLPLDALAGAVERENMGSLHLVLRPDPMWLPDEETLAADRRMRETLQEAGLLDRRGRLDVEFLDWLPLLTNASLEYYGWVHDGQRTYGILTAARGLQGIVAVRVGDGIALKPVPRDRLTDALVAELPDVRPGGGRPLVIRVAELEEAGREDRIPSWDIRDLVNVLQRPVTGTGELYAARRDELNRYHRLEQPLHYADTDWGRYLNYTLGTGDEAEIHLAPGHPTALIEHLLQLEQTLPG